MGRRIPILEELAAVPGRLERALGDLLIPDWALGGFGTVPPPLEIQLQVDLTAWEAYLRDDGAN